MAANAKPNIEGLGKEGTINIISSSGDGYIYGLLDGVCANEWNTSRVFYWNAPGSSYIEFSTDVPINIWRCGTTGWASSHWSTFTIYKQNELGVYVNITNDIEQYTSPITEKQWEKSISNLQEGTYKFVCPGTRIDSEWYIEELEEENVMPDISYKNASLTYTLPMATTRKIKAKSNDKRLGLLGMASDDKNFGDLYVVGKDGKSHLTKSGIKSEILFDGNASVLNEKYVLSKPITDFKMLVFFSSASSPTSSGFNVISVVVSVEDIKYINNEFYVNLYQGGYERNFNFTIHNDNISFSITRQTLGGLSSIQITKIIGIY